MLAQEIVGVRLEEVEERRNPVGADYLQRVQEDERHRLERVVDVQAGSPKFTTAGERRQRPN